jgi:Ni,Fe-hydrogenase maturation factor
VGVEGQDFSHGEGLSSPVEAGVARAVDLVVELARREVGERLDKG